MTDCVPAGATCLLWPRYVCQTRLDPPGHCVPRTGRAAPAM